MPSTRTLRLCNNKSALDQRAEEADLSLAHLRQYSKRQNRQYQHPATVVGGKGLEMADAIDIADKINLLSKSLKDVDVAAVDFDLEALQLSLQQASKTIGFISKQRSEAPTKGVTFYDDKVIPKSPLKTSNAQTPRRSNVSTASQAAMACPSPQRLLHTASTAALSCSSGYLATIGEFSPPASPGVIELSDDDEVKAHAALRKKGKTLSLDFSKFPSNGEGKKKIKIKKGDVAIKVWGESVGGLTLTTGGPFSSGENDSAASTPSQGIDIESSDNRTSSKNPKSCALQRRLVFPWQKKNETLARQGQIESTARTNDAVESSIGHGADLENLVLGAMQPQQSLPSLHSLSQTKQNEEHNELRRKDGEPASDNQVMPTMSNLSYVSELLPNDRFGHKKFQTVKTDDEKGFEVYLEGSSSASRYSSSKLRERAELSEKLRSKRREIRSIQEDLDACSLLLGNFNDTTVPTVHMIKEDKQDDYRASKQGSRAIVRE